MVILAVPLVDAEIVSAAGKNIPVFESPDGLIDGALVLPADTVVIPDTTRLDAVALPKVLIPVIFKSVKVLGAFATALSIVAVVVASNEAMFCSCLALLITLMFPILKDPTVLTPDTLMDSVVTVPVVSIPAVVTLVNGIIVF